MHAPKGERPLVEPPEGEAYEKYSDGFEKWIGQILGAEILVRVYTSS